MQHFDKTKKVYFTGRHLYEYGKDWCSLSLDWCVAQTTNPNIIGSNPSKLRPQTLEDTDLLFQLT